MRTVQPLVGLYAGRVYCICLGPPPCVSRAVVPRFIRTIVSGDDVVPRASPQSLDTVKKRVSTDARMNTSSLDVENMILLL